jgi:vitamin B12 transporter
MVLRSPALAVALILSLPCLGAAQGEDQPPQVLRHDIVVTATRTETPEKKVGSSVTVITGEELARTRRTSVFEALEDVLGLAAFRTGGPGAAASVSIRGAGSEHTLVLLDGLELNDPINPSRSYDLAHLSLSQVERIEVLRGPQGLLYGSDALGGVVNIITRKGRGAPSLSLASSADSLSSLVAEVGLSGSGRRTDYALDLRHERTAGLSAASSAYAGNGEKDGYRDVAFSGRFGWTVRPGAELDLTVRAVRDRTELDNFGGPGGDDPNSVQDYGMALVRARFRLLSKGGRHEQTLSASWLGASRENRNPFDEAHPAERDEGLYLSDLFKLDWQNNFFLHPAHTLTAGLELEREKGRSDYVSESAWGVAESSFPSARAGSAGVFLLDRWESGGRFFVTAGVRADRHSQAGTALTFRLAPAYLVAATGTKFKASYGTGFKSPSLYQLFAPETSWGPVGNPGLRPERVAGWDAGVEQDLFGGRLVAGLTWFSNSFRDLIDFDFAAGYVNTRRARTKGLEASVKTRPGGGLRWGASYTRLSARDVDAGTGLLRRPRDKFAAEAGARIAGRFDLTLTALRVGRRLDRDFSAAPYQTVTLPAYVLLDAVLAAAVAPRLEFFIRLDNILDARCEQVWGYGSPGFSVGTGFRYAR